MAVRTLEKQEWHGYFDRISRGLLGIIPTPAANPGYRWGGRPPRASMCQSGVLMTPHEGGARDDG